MYFNRRPTESSHQIHASLCVPLIQVQHLFNKFLWCNTSAADNLSVSILSQRMLHPCLLDTVYLRLTWTLYFWLTLLPPQGLTSPKPERGCVKTDCFDEALCREYEQHHVMTSSTINHKHHLRLMMMMWFIGRWWKVMEGRKGIEQWWDALFSFLVFFADSWHCEHENFCNRENFNVLAPSMCGAIMHCHEFECVANHDDNDIFGETW